MPRDYRGRVELWEGTGGRWYYARVVNGIVVDAGDVSSRRAARRAILSRWPDIRIDVVAPTSR